MIKKRLIVMLIFTSSMLLASSNTTTNSSVNSTTDKVAIQSNSENTTSKTKDGTKRERVADLSDPTEIFSSVGLKVDTQGNVDVDVGVAHAGLLAIMKTNNAFQGFKFDMAYMPKGFGPYVSIDGRNEDIYVYNVGLVMGIPVSYVLGITKSPRSMESRILLLFPTLTYSYIQFKDTNAGNMLKEYTGDNGENGYSVGGYTRLTLWYRGSRKTGNLEKFYVGFDPQFVSEFGKYHNNQFLWTVSMGFQYHTNNFSAQVDNENDDYYVTFEYTKQLHLF